MTSTQRKRIIYNYVIVSLSLEHAIVHLCWPVFILAPVKFRSATLLFQQYVSNLVPCTIHKCLRAETRTVLGLAEERVVCEWSQAAS
jgi:hypothetical protein